MRVQKLDRILDRHDVVVVRFVDEVDNGRQRRALATPGWSSDKHDSVLNIYYLFQYVGQIEITELRRPHRNHAHDDRVRAALLEDINAKTSVAGNTERQIRGATLFKTVEGRLLVADNQFRDAGGMARRQLVEPGNANRHEFSGQFDLWWPPGTEYQIAHFV